MTTPSFDDQLRDWIADGPETAPVETLEAVLATFPTTRQRWGAWRAPWRFDTMKLFSSALAGAAIVAVVAVGIYVIARENPDDPGGVASPPAVVATASPSATATPSPTPTPTPTPSPTPTASAGPVACVASDLSALIVRWEGAAGSRIASVVLTNAGDTACLVATMDQPQLLDGTSAILIQGPAPTDLEFRSFEPGATLTTMVSASNYCGPDPVAPVTLGFVLADGSRVVATPESPTDTGVPPCNGAGSGAEISMHPWAP